MDIKKTGKYGFVYNDSIYFNEKENIYNKELLYRVSKVNVWIGKRDNKDIICGIQFYYRNLKNGNEVTFGANKGDKYITDMKQIILEPTEYLCDFNIRIDQEVTQIGFSSNKGKTYLFGGESGEKKITELNDNQGIIIAPFGSFGDYLHSCGMYYIDKNEYMMHFIYGYFELRFALKHRPKFKEKCEKLKLNSVDQVLLRVCRLPDRLFHCIMKNFIF